MRNIEPTGIGGFRKDFESLFGRRLADPNEEVRGSWLRSLAEHHLDPDRVRDPDVLSYSELVEHRAPVEELSALCLPEIDRLLHRVMVRSGPKTGKEPMVWVCACGSNARSRWCKTSTFPPNWHR